MALLRSTLGEKAVLVTGSAGYLGFSLYLTLQKLGVAVFGVDVVSGATVDVVADVADAEVMRRCGQGCGAVLHTAALHAPHALSWHAREFTATNVAGTENVLALGLPTVHTSTTSLTITSRVRAREAAGEVVWLDESAQRPDLREEKAIETTSDMYDPPLDDPRNKYGRTKLQGEQRCLATARDGASVVVLRAPRFFPEDAIENNNNKQQHLQNSALSQPNLKANELLGRRCALVDLIDAELRALARIRAVRGRVLTLVPPCPIERPCNSTSAREVAFQLKARLPQAERLYALHGWRLPDAITRIYDGEAAMKVLDWQPRVTFEALLGLMDQHGHEAHEKPEAEEGESVRPCKQPRAADSSRSQSGAIFQELLRGAY